MRTLKLMPLLAAVLLTAACKNDEPSQPDGNGFDTEAMLTNVSSSVIIPAYSEAVQAVQGLSETFEQYKANPTQAQYLELRSAFLNAYTAWQDCSPFEFGPAADINLRLTVNTFPADTARIQALFETQDYDLSLANNSAAKGFPALDYVLYGMPDSALSTDGVTRFMRNNISMMQDALSQVLTQWKGTFAAEFNTSV